MDPELGGILDNLHAHLKDALHLKGWLFHILYYLFKKLKRVFASIEFQKYCFSFVFYGYALKLIAVIVCKDWVWIEN